MFILTISDKSQKDSKNKDTEFIYSLAEELINFEKDFSEGVQRKDTISIINRLNKKLNMKIDADKITLKLFNKSDQALGFLELLENIRDFISNKREKVELHFFVLAKVLDKRKKNTLQILEKYGLVELGDENPVQELDTEADVRFPRVNQVQFITHASGMLGLSKKNTEKVFKHISSGHEEVNVKDVTELIDQFRSNYHFKKYFEFEISVDARTKADRLIEVLDSEEAEDFLDHFKEQNIAFEDFGDLEGHLDASGKVCLLDLRASLIEDMERAEKEPDSRIIGRFLKKCDLDSNGSLEVKEFVLILHIEKLRTTLTARPAFKEQKKEKMLEQLQAFLEKDVGNNVPNKFQKENYFFNSIFQIKEDKHKCSKSQEASFVREYNRKFNSNLKGSHQREPSMQESQRRTDRSDNTVNEIRQLIDNEIFDSQEKNSKNFKKKRRPNRDGEDILNECIDVLQRENMTFQDILDELDFDANMDISVIKIRQYFNYKFQEEDSRRRMIKSLRHLDKNRNGSSNYMEILEFFTGTANDVDINPLKMVFLNNDLSRSMGRQVGELIKSKNQKYIGDNLRKGIHQITNQKDHERLKNMGEKERLSLFVSTLEKNELAFEELIDDMDYDANLDVPMIHIKNYFKSKIEDKGDIRVILSVVQKMDVNKNGNINYSEFIEFLQKLKKFEENGQELSEENDIRTESESPLNTGNLNSSSLHHKFKFNKTFKQSQFKRQLDHQQKKESTGSHFKTLLRQASSQETSFKDSLHKMLSQMGRSDSSNLDPKIETALYKLKKLNASELMNLKDSSDTVFACASEIGFLGLRSLFEQAQIQLSMAEGLAVFKLIDDNKSHRICQLEFEEFISKLLKEIQTENEEKFTSQGMNETRNKKMMSTLQQELSKALFSNKSMKKSFQRKRSSLSGSNMAMLKNKLGNFATKKLNEMSTVNQSSIDIFTELNKMKENKFQNFKYIFNCPLNALKACLEITRELERTKSVLFTDPEFGPNDTDKYGKQSMYFADTLPGYPQPEDINWLHLSEISGQESKFPNPRPLPLFERRREYQRRDSRKSGRLLVHRGHERPGHRRPQHLPPSRRQTPGQERRQPFK